MTAAALGAFTSKYGASLSCNNWPGCTDIFLPNFSDMFQVIHFSHRVIAMILVLVIVSLFIGFMKYFKVISKNIRLILLGISFIIVTQVIIGALLIYNEVPIWMGSISSATGLFAIYSNSITVYTYKFKKILIKIFKMKYTSTREDKGLLNFRQVTLKGLASDGGLYVPKNWKEPSLRLANTSASFEQTAFEVIQHFVGNSLDEKYLRRLIKKSYRGFRKKEITTLKKLDNNNFILELFHGPTLAFKDIALQF